MDVRQNTTRDRVFSILNDNDCPSFVIRQKQASTTSPLLTKLPSIASFSPRLERPAFARNAQYKRNSSVSSAGSPPLLRYDSASSKSSSSSMDSTPSPITPAYSLNDANTLSYDGLQPGLGTSYLQSPSAITPFMEQQLMIAPATTAHLPPFEPKTMMMPNIASGIYPAIPHQQDAQQLPTPALSNHPSVSSSSSAPSKTSPKGNSNNAPPTAKKNKYPCPYASSHNCTVTFTTSGHAARHGKKHTGEKGVHCPVCNKAFTRKDNMKQHERTHKNAAHKGSEETRSKAAITKDAQKSKAHRKSESESTSHTRKPSIIQSPLSEAPSLAPHTVDTPVNLTDSTFYQDPSPPLLLGPDATLVPESLVSNSMYPPLGDETLLHGPSSVKLDGLPQMPPTLVRGFSDLDTLAQAAESFDPYYQGQF